MEFRQIEHFLELYQTQNMTKASRALFISQQGLSRSIKNLEDELHLVLFNKSQRGAIPTSEAAELKPFFETLLRDRRYFLSQVEKLQNVSLSKPIDIACAYDFYYSPIHTCFEKFKKLFPEIPLNFIPMPEKERLKTLYSGNCSFAMIDSPQSDSQIISLGILYRETCAAVMHRSHPLSSQTVFSWEMARNMNLAVADSDSKLAQDIRFYLQQSDSVPGQFFTPDSLLEIIPKILEEKMIGIIAPATLNYFDKTDLSILPIEPLLSEQFHLVTIKDLSQTPFEHQFFNYFTDTLKENG